MGRLDEGLSCGLRARQISETLQDHYLFYNAHSALSRIYWFRGESQKVLEIAEVLLDFGRRNSNMRCLVAGHISEGHGYSAAGGFPAAVASFERAVELAADPLYAEWPRFHLAFGYIQNGEYSKAGIALQELLAFSEKYGYEAAGTAAQGLLGIVMITRGQFMQGLEILTNSHRSFQRNGHMVYKDASAHLLMGRIFSQISQRKRSGRRTLPSIINILFLLKNIPLAGRKAERHLDLALAMAGKMKAKGMQGQIYLEKALLDIARKRKASAEKNIRQSIALFRQCEATAFLQRAIDVLNTL
jgi:tetratricopeptide (TPR) repeat protein